MRRTQPATGSPQTYRPHTSGIYRVEAGLAPLERDAGRGPLDACVFQFGPDADRLLANKRACMEENASKYFGYAEPSEQTMATACATLQDRLAAEQGASVGSNEDIFHAIAMAIPEDLCVVQVDPGEGDRLVAAHVCAPSHWDPREKLGLSFRDIHAPVPGIEKVNAKAPSLVQALVHGRYKRMGWSLTTDDRPNHHPEPPRDFNGTPETWQGKTFDPDNPRLFVRVERQTFIGLPAVNAFLFTIRLYFHDCRTMPPEERMQLRSAIRSMTPESQMYKGINGQVDAIVQWLAARGKSGA